MLQWIKWAGISKDGKKQQGIIEAPNAKIAASYLKQQGILVKKLGKKSIGDYFRKKIPATKITSFFRQLATLSKANLTIAQSLNILHKGQATKPMKRLIQQVKEDVERGISLATAFKRQDTYFQETICHLVAAGERTGKLATILEKIADTAEKQQRLKENIKKALTYPMLVFITSLVVTYGLLIFIIPQFQQLFQSLNADLPLLTRCLLYAADLIKHSAFPLTILLTLLLFLFLILRKNIPAIAFFFDKNLLKCPVLGSILKTTAIARFASTLNLSLAAGLSLVEALKIGAKINRNQCFIFATEDILQALAVGHPLHTAMKNTGVFPPIVTELVAIGEETGSIDTMFAKIYSLLEKSIDETVDKLRYALEPIILLVVGLFVGLLVIALYLPIFKLGSAL